VDTGLDKDYWPIWLVKCAGLAFPFFALAGSLVGMVVQHRRDMLTWLLVVWSTILLLLFFSQYRAHKFGSLGLEFHYGLVFILIPVFSKFMIEEFPRFEWITIPLLGCGLVLNAFRYLKRFYLTSNAQLDAKG
jgi:hypothetical protein